MKDSCDWLSCFFCWFVLWKLHIISLQVRMTWCYLISAHNSLVISFSTVGGSNGGWWSCTCDDGGFPKVASQTQDTTCFSACNCTSGVHYSFSFSFLWVISWRWKTAAKYLLAHFSCISIFQAGALNDIPVSGKHNSSKVVVVTLLLCVILTTIAFLSSIMCYLYRKRSFSTMTPVFSSEKEESCNSASNLINNITSSVPKTKSSISSHATPFTGWLASLYLSDHCTKYPILFCHRLKLSSSGFFFLSSMVSQGLYSIQRQIRNYTWDHMPISICRVGICNQ